MLHICAYVVAIVIVKRSARLVELVPLLLLFHNVKAARVEIGTITSSTIVQVFICSEL